MTSALFTLSPTDTVADAFALMQEKKVRCLPVVDSSGSFIGLFGLRRLSRLLLPKAVLDLGRHSISELHFLPDEVVQDSDRWREVSEQPVANFLEKKKKLLFCTPQTPLPELLALLDQSKDSSLPVIVIEGDAKKSSRDGIELGCSTSHRHGPSNHNKGFSSSLIAGKLSNA